MFLRTENFDLRSDQLEFRGEKQTLQADSNVYLKQADLDADCGKMVYDLKTDIMTLTMDPVVRQATPTGRTVARELESFLIHHKPDGTTFTEMVGGSKGQPRIDYEQMKPAKPASTDPITTGAIEIQLGDDKIIDRIPK